MLQGAATATILIAGQAPGRRAHERGIPFDDRSGDWLRAERLERVDLPVEEVERTMWLLIHPDLRGTERVKALMNHLLAGLQKDKDAFIGNEPTVN